VIAGESAALIHDVLSAKAIVENIVREMDEILGYSSYKQTRELKAYA